ncbi:MAG: class I SAM-dependent methyltransferase [Nitrososphaerales archaeon]
MDRADRVLREIEEQSEKEPMIIIGPIRGAILDEAVLRYRPRRVVEVGTLVGYSAIRMGRLMDPGGTITCLEVDGGVAAVAKANVARAGLEGVIEVKVGDALELLPALDGELDMVFIDAEKEEYLAYLRLAEPRIRRGGVVLADNVKRFASRMGDYLDYVRLSGRYSSRCIESESAFDPAGDAVEVSIKL